MSRAILDAQHATWQTKPALRAIYGDYYERIAAACIPGTTLEIGGGSGNFKQQQGNVISSDLVVNPWVDAAADAQSLPFANGSLSNIVAVDVLHHLEFPLRFFTEARRALVPSGRIVLLEPAITPASYAFYRWFHPEPVDTAVDPFSEAPPDPNRAPFDANQALPTLLFRKHRTRFAARFPSLRVVRLEWLSYFAYPLSGGFRPWSLVPTRAVAPLLKLEAALRPILGSVLAFRLLVVIERTADAPS